LDAFELGAMPVAISSRLPGERGLPPRVAGLRWLTGAAIGVPIIIITSMGLLQSARRRCRKGLPAYLGHRSIASTVRYTKLAPDRFKGIWKD
jgi:hypothetical protein